MSTICEVLLYCYLYLHYLILSKNVQIYSQNIERTWYTLVHLRRENEKLISKFNCYGLS